MSTSTTGTQSRAGGRWIQHWDPEDEAFWEGGGKRTANRNLLFSVLSEHIGFSIWSLWSVMVLFMGPKYHVDPAGKFFLVAMPTLVGAFVRVPYTFAVARFGGRNWTVFAALLLLLPTLAAAYVMHPGTSYTTFMVVAALTGVGGGNFASSMTNINAFFPMRRKGWALGLNAGGGNLGVPVIQLIALAVITWAGAGHPRIVLGVYLPLVIVSATCAALFMDNLAPMRNDGGALAEVLREKHTWLMSVLYIGTFGSFIGPLLGSLIRPVGGKLADRWGGSRITFWNFVAMAAATGLVTYASSVKSLPVFLVGFIALFVLAGLGNGSTYKMIPGIFDAKAQDRIATLGATAEQSAAWSRRMSGAAIGIIGAVGAVGGLLINLAFRQSFLVAKSGTPAFASFLGAYAVCCALTWTVYLRRPAPAATAGRTPALAQV